MPHLSERSTKAYHSSADCLCLKIMLWWNGSAEEMLKTNPQLHDEMENAEKAVKDLSSGGIQDVSTDRASSIRNVVLWVSDMYTQI